MKTSFFNALNSCFAAVLFLFVAILIIGAIEYFLWNALMPQIFGLPEITLWQAIGLYALVRLMFENRITDNKQ